MREAKEYLELEAIVARKAGEDMEREVAAEEAAAKATKAENEERGEPLFFGDSDR